MSVTAAMIVTNAHVTSSQLARWGVKSTKQTGDLWTAFFDPTDRSFVVAQAEAVPGARGPFTEGEQLTLLWDTDMQVSPEFEVDSLDDAGTWVVLSVVGTTNFVDLRVFRDGSLVRHLQAGEDGVVDKGEPVFDETPYVYPVDEGEDSEGAGADKTEFEVEGDQLLENLPRLTGFVAQSANPWEILGDYYAYAGDDSGGKKPGFFGRVFGRR